MLRALRTQRSTHLENLTPRGTFGTTDDVGWLDVMLKYDFRWGVDWFVRLDVFNLFNWSAVTEVNEAAEQVTSSAS